MVSRSELTSARWAHLLDASEDRGVGADLPARSFVFDVLLALVFTGLGSTFLPIFFPAARTSDFVFVVGVNLPLLLRRRLPKAAFALVLISAVVQVFFPRPIGIHDGAVLFALYSLAGYTNRRIGLIGLAGTLALTASGWLTDWWDYIDEQLTGGRFDPVVHLLVLIGMVILVLASWATGERLRSSRIGLTALAERAATLEREREQQALLVAAEERSRIAREMHDVIAHALSVMIAQADGGRYVLETSPAEAGRALERISRAGRDSLVQMRGLLGLLREGESSLGLTPQPGLDQLTGLITEAEESGLRVGLRQVGEPSSVGQLVGLTAFRIVQEGFSNALKYGGPEVRIDLHYEAGGITVTMINSGPTKAVASTGPGHGLTGMAERVAAVGGRLETGPTPTGFRIAAWLPYAGRLHGERED